MRWQIPVGVLLVAGLLTACDQAPTAAEADQAQEPAAFKVEKTSFRFTLDNAPTETYIECLGETLLWFGTYDLLWTEKVTSSGNWVASWKLDYFDTTEPTWLMGDTSGTIWNVTKAENQGTGWLIQDKGTKDFLHYQSNEWYENAAGDRLHIRIKGQMMYDDGDPKVERHDVKGFCH